MPRRSEPMTNPMTLGDMRAKGIRSVYVDCGCNRAAMVNVDHLPDILPVPSVRLGLRCSECGERPERTMPAWKESNVKRPGYPV